MNTVKTIFMTALTVSMFLGLIYLTAYVPKPVYHSKTPQPITKPTIPLIFY